MLVKPEEVGLSAPRLGRIRTHLQRYIEAGKLAGTLTLVARQGQIAYFEPQGHLEAERTTYRKFKGHFSAGPSGAQPAKRPLEYPGSGKVAVVFTPRHHGMSQQPRLACRVPHARDQTLAQGAELVLGASFLCTGGNPFLHTYSQTCSTGFSPQFGDSSA